VRSRAKLACSAFAWLAAAAAAEDAAPRAEEIVVWGARSEPAAVLEPSVGDVEALERAEIAVLPVTSLDEVLATLPGIRTQARVQGEEAAISIEGLPPEHSKVLVDGARYEGEVGGADDLRDYPTLFLRSLAVRRGPQGLRFGPDAAGGVIEVSTLRGPEAGDGGSIELAGGSDAAFVGGFHLRERFGEQTVALTALQDQIDGFDPPASGAVRARAGGEDSRRLSRDVFLALDGSAGGRAVWFADAGFRREDEDFVPVGGGATTRRDQSRWRATAGARLDLRERSSLETSLAYFARDTDSTVGRAYEQTEREWKLDLTLEHARETRFGSHSLAVGIDARRASLALSEGELPPELEGMLSADAAHEKLSGAGFFLIDEVQLAEWLTLELGAREELSSDFDAAFAAQAGALVAPFVSRGPRPLESLRLRASVGRNHRAPGLQELFQPETPQLGGAYFLSGNPALRPERTLGVRAGLEWAPSERAAFSVTWFRNHIEDGIRSVRARTLLIPTGEFQEVPDLDDERLVGLWRICRAIDFALPDCAALIGVPVEQVPITRPADVFVKTNLDRVETRGIEALLQLRPFGGLALDVGYTHLESAVRDGESAQLRVLPNQPRHQLDWRLRATLPRTRTSFALTGRWRGEAVTETSGTGLISFSNPAALSDPSVLLSTRIAQPIGERFELFVDVDNLSDVRVQDSYAIRGRTVFGGVRVRFGADVRDGGGAW
jgi:outer membrane receptor protein involved in Fe transport